MRKQKLLKSGIAAVLAAAMILSSAACGNQDGGTAGGEGDAAKPETGQEQGSEPASSDYEPLGAYEETVPLSIGRGTVTNPKLPDGASYENNAYSDWVKDRLNIQCTNAFEAMEGEDYDRQVSLAIASEELPDVMIVSKDILDELVENDLIADLTESYQNYASDYIKNIYDSYEGRCLGSATYDGKLMALPSTNPDDAPGQVWIRQDWLDALGIKIDEDGNSIISREELEMVAKEFVEKDPGNSGNPVGIAFSYTMDGSNNLGIAAINNSFGAFQKLWLQKEDGTVYNGSTSPEMKESLAFLAGLFEKGLIDPQFGTRTWEDITALMTNGQTGISFGVWHIPDWLLSNVKSMDPAASYTSFALDNGSGKVSAAHSNAAGSYIVVRKGYEHPEAAVKIVNLFHDERVTSKTLAEDAPAVAEYESTGVDGSVRPFRVEINSSDSLLNDYHSIVDCLDGTIALEEVPTLEARNMVGHIERYQEDPNTEDAIDWSRYHSRMKGIFLIDTLTVQDAFDWTSPLYLGNTETMKSNQANLDKLEEETFIKMIIGELSVDDFDAFVEEWNAQGGAAICEELAQKLQ